MGSSGVVSSVAYLRQRLDNGGSQVVRKTCWVSTSGEADSCCEKPRAGHELKELSSLGGAVGVHALRVGSFSAWHGAVFSETSDAVDTYSWQWSSLNDLPRFYREFIPARAPAAALSVPIPSPHAKSRLGNETETSRLPDCACVRDVCVGGGGAEIFEQTVFIKREDL